jgi:hypothetical protein
VARLALLLLLVVIVAGPRSAGAASSGRVDTDLLNLRDGPGTWATVIDQMPQGSPVRVLDGPTDDGWYKVRYDGIVGWAYGGYLSVDGAPGWATGGETQAGPEHWIDVSRSNGTVTLYVGDEAIATYYASFGYDTSADGFYSTALGTYYVYGKNADLTWTEWGHAYIMYWVAFDPDRYNGFHSWSMDANGNVIPGGDGPTGGCIATEPSAAAAIYDFADYGTRVEIHW